VKFEPLLQSKTFICLSDVLQYRTRNKPALICDLVHNILPHITSLPHYLLLQLQPHIIFPGALSASPPSRPNGLHLLRSYKPPTHITQPFNCPQGFLHDLSKYPCPRMHHLCVRSFEKHTRSSPVDQENDGASVYPQLAYLPTQWSG
jgi:hypothetical protein